MGKPKQQSPTPLTNSTGPIFPLHLHHHTAEGIDSPGFAEGLVSWVGRHWVGNGCRVAVDPVLVDYIMTVGT